MNFVDTRITAFFYLIKTIFKSNFLGVVSMWKGKLNYFKFKEQFDHRIRNISTIAVGLFTERNVVGKFTVNVRKITIFDRNFEPHSNYHKIYYNL